MKVRRAMSVPSVRKFVKSYPEFEKLLKEKVQDERALKRTIKLFGKILDAEGEEAATHLAQKYVENYAKKARQALRKLTAELDVTLPIG